MVASNDNDESEHGTVGRRQRRNVYVTGTPGAQPTYTYTLTYTSTAQGSRGGNASLAVTDDLGSHIEVRRGECVIIGTLIVDLMSELEAKTANDR